MVEKELGAPIDEIFSEFSPKPIAAASLAQVRGGQHAQPACMQQQQQPPCSAANVLCHTGNWEQAEGKSRGQPPAPDWLLLAVPVVPPQLAAACRCRLGAPQRRPYPTGRRLLLTAAVVAACLLDAQVYFARVRATGQAVAVKVQRPGALSTISKDLYVMRRGVGVYEQLVKRFTAQTTDYQQLLSTFAEGLYTEMDFRNEVGEGACWQLPGKGGRKGGRQSVCWQVFLVG